MGENKSRIKDLVPQSLVDSYGEYAPVVNYLLVLAETPQMGVMVTSSVHDLYQRQNEVGKKSLFEGASRFWEHQPDKLKHVLFAIPGGVDHLSLVEIVSDVLAVENQGGVYDRVLATLVHEIHCVWKRAFLPDGSPRDRRVIQAYRAACEALEGVESFPRA